MITVLMRGAVPWILVCTLAAAVGFAAGWKLSPDKKFKANDPANHAERAPERSSVATDPKRELMTRYPTVIVAASKVPDYSAFPYRDWRMKIRCRGIKGDLKKDFFAEIQCVKDHKPLETIGLKKGMRVNLDMVPIEQAPQETQHWPVSDDVDDFSLPVFWVQGLEHNEPRLKLATEPGRERFASLAIETVLKSPVAVPCGAEESPFYFYGANWEIYKGEAEDRLTAVQTDSPMNAVRHFHDWLKQRGVRLIFAPIPQSASLFPDVATGKFDGGRLKASPANSAVRRMLEQLRRDGVAVVDFSAVMQESRMEAHEGKSYPIYLPNDTHWASGAAAMAAKACAEMLVRQKIIEPRRGNLFGSQQIEVVHNGDLNHVSAVMNLQVRLPALPTLLHKVIPRSDEAQKLLEDPGPSAEVHCVGDSYLFIHRDQQAGFVDHLVRETSWPVHVVAGNASAQRVSVRAWLRDSAAGKAKVVIWMPAERFLGFDEWIDVENEPAAKR